MNWQQPPPGGYNPYAYQQQQYAGYLQQQQQRLAVGSPQPQQPPQAMMMMYQQHQQPRPGLGFVAPQQQQQQQQVVQGAATTIANVPMNVFVGKLALNLDDSFLEHVLKQCGNVLKWKRTTDAETNAPKAFGFCTYADATGAMQAVRVLNDFVIGNSRILVKVGKKEQLVIDRLRGHQQGLTVAEAEILGKIQRLVQSVDPTKPFKEDVGGGESEAGAGPNQTASIGGGDEELAKFRTKQAQRDRELEEERRRKLQAKIQETIDKQEEEKQANKRRKKAASSEDAAPVLVSAHQQPTSIGASTTKVVGFGLKQKKSIAPKPSVFAQDNEPTRRRRLQKLDDDDDEGDPVIAADSVAATIPKDKSVFSLPIDWEKIEARNIVRSKLRPWIAKQILDFLGEEEQTLIDYVATQLENRASYKEIANELALVLEDDAHTFILNLWRVLHFHAAQS